MKLRKWLLRGVCFIILLTLAIGAAVCIAFGVEGYCMYREALAKTPLAQRVQQVWEQPDFVPLSELPPIYINAVIAVEDHRFFQHGGIDPIAIGRALWNDLKAMSPIEGGSTITQQLAKNLFFTQEKLLSRKAAEVFMAFALERHYTKGQILELYLNSIYFGSGYTGVGAAAKGYFGKEPKDMTDAQSTLLAGIPNAPSAYSPDENPELAIQRQRQVLRRMEECGYITPSQAAALCMQPAV